VPVDGKLGTDMDPNYWGIVMVPIGVVVCFWPALLAAAFWPSKDPNIEERGKPRDCTAAVPGTRASARFKGRTSGPVPIEAA
jgi:hypothetical protein